MLPIELDATTVFIVVVVAVAVKRMRINDKGDDDGEIVVFVVGGWGGASQCKL